jgi:hypothetical protein
MLIVIADAISETINKIESKAQVPGVPGFKSRSRIKRGFGIIFNRSIICGNGLSLGNIN